MKQYIFLLLFVGLACMATDCHKTINVVYLYKNDSGHNLRMSIYNVFNGKLCEDITILRNQVYRTERNVDERLVPICPFMCDSLVVVYEDDKQQIFTRSKAYTEQEISRSLYSSQAYEHGVHVYTYTFTEADYLNAK